MTRRLRHPVLLATLLAAVVLTGCDRDQPGPDTGGSAASHSSGSNGSGKLTYSVGGTLTGLTGSGLSLSASNNLLTVAAGTTAFTLPNLFAAGASYSVTIRSEPQGQTCLISSGNGTMATANVTNVQVACTRNTYSVGGTITGLNAGGLILSNGSDALTISTGTSAFVFHLKVAAGAAYAVAIDVQPTALNCQVINGTGVVPFVPVTDVTVVCGQWSWIGGSGNAGAGASYGTEGSPSASNNPGARTAAVSWIDHSGNLWLFGGNGPSGNLNDLWQYTPGSGTWTWRSGSSTSKAAGMYGTEGAAGPGNVPGARGQATAWLDSSGNLWLFGGQGYDSTGATGSLNDLWKYNVGVGQWTWEGGAQTAWAAGAVPPSNAPGARTGAVSWSDAAGNLWLFGGMGTQGLTADLWEFAPGTDQWSLVSGSQTPNTLGSYGTEGTAAGGNVPGSRTQAVASIDAAGNLWLFGGSGYGSIGSTGLLNDLWKFDPIAGHWTWMAGWKTANAAGVYGTRSTTDIKQPGARYAATAVSDGAGNLWLFGGMGYDAAGAEGSLNDMWQYNMGLAQWIWMSGSQSSGAASVYGTQGVAAAGDGPGARSGAVSWMDGSGNFWLLGGQGSDSTGTAGVLGDLWQFAP